jgi:hypothetical protein
MSHAINMAMRTTNHAFSVQLLLIIILFTYSSTLLQTRRPTYPISATPTNTAASIAADSVGCRNADDFPDDACE